MTVTTLVLALVTFLSAACQWIDTDAFDNKFRTAPINRPAFARTLRPRALGQDQPLTWKKGGGTGDADLALLANGSVTYTDRGHLAFVISEQAFSGNFILEYTVPNTAQTQCASQVGIMLANLDFPPGNDSESAYFWHNGRGESNALFRWTQSEGWSEVPVVSGDRISIHSENGTVKLYKNFDAGTPPLETRTVPAFQTAELKVFAKFVPDRFHRSESLLNPRLTLK